MGGPDTGEKHYCADHKRLPGGSEMSGNLREKKEKVLSLVKI